MIYLKLANNRLLSQLFGPNDQFLNYIEKSLNIFIYTRGEIIAIDGNKNDCEFGRSVINKLYQQLIDNHPLDLQIITNIVNSTLMINEQDQQQFNSFKIVTPRKEITAFSINQLNYLKAIHQFEIIIAYGPAGTGKTYLAVALGLKMLLTNQVKRIILCRPAIEAGEKLGFLPGDLKDKVDPYLRPLYDSLGEMLLLEQLNRYLQNKDIEILPLAFMRGRTLNDSIIIVDEAQNATSNQMKMLLTRIGNNSKLIIVGDPLQVDLPFDKPSGLIDAVNRLKNIDEIAIIRLENKDIIRNSLINKILTAYEA